MLIYVQIFVKVAIKMKRFRIFSFCSKVKPVVRSLKSFFKKTCIVSIAAHNFLLKNQKTTHEDDKSKNRGIRLLN